MNGTPLSALLAKYQEQNTEIIKTNVKLNERIAILESVITQLQQENLQLRIDNVKQRRKIPKTRKQKKTIPNINEPSSPVVLSQKRSCTIKPINYVLPSKKSKLRKGDPFTFGN